MSFSSIFSNDSMPNYLKLYNRDVTDYNKSIMNANQSLWGQAQNAAAMDYTTHPLYATAMGAYMNANPYTAQMAMNAANAVQNTYNTSYIPKALSDFASSGRYGSGLFQQNMMNLQNNMESNAANAATNVYAQQYDTKRKYMNDAMSQLGQQYDPLNRLNTYGNILSNSKYGSTVGNEINGMTMNDLTSLMGATSGMMGGAGGMMKGIGAIMSDRRIKTDIRRVGYLDNGLPVYAYRYKGDTITHLGLMAQEVKRKNPRAVTRVGRWLTVRYDLAVE